MKYSTIKFLFMFILGIAAGCCVHTNPKGSGVWSTLSDSDMISSTVALVHYKNKTNDTVDPDDKEGMLKVYCSGVWVSPNVILTAAHCVEDAGKPNKTIDEEIINHILGLESPTWNPLGQKIHYSTKLDIWEEPNRDFRGSHTSKVIAFYPEYDLALLKATPLNHDLEIPPHAVARLSKDIMIGSETRIVGHPGGLWWTFTKGTVSAIHMKAVTPRNSIVNAVQISAPIWFGNSGGGAFNETGELIGICSWIKDVPNTSFFIHTSAIEVVLNENKIFF
jgi:S1-C subfamily serine protease